MWACLQQQCSLSPVPGVQREASSPFSFPSTPLVDLRTAHAVACVLVRVQAPPRVWQQFKYATPGPTATSSGSTSCIPIMVRPVVMTLSVEEVCSMAGARTAISPHYNSTVPFPVPAQIPVQVLLHGNISAGVVAAPSIGVLLRLSFACYLGLPLPSVLINRVETNETTGSIDSCTSTVFDKDAPVNVQDGLCAAVLSNSTGARRLQSLSVTPTCMTAVQLQVRTERRDLYIIYNRCVGLFAAQYLYYHQRVCGVCACRYLHAPVRTAAPASPRHCRTFWHT
jgi:hypothetical protein